MNSSMMKQKMSQVKINKKIKIEYVLNVFYLIVIFKYFNLFTINYLNLFTIIDKKIHYIYNCIVRFLQI